VDGKKEVWEVGQRVVNLHYSNEVIQKGLSDLQLLDNIIGHADRHPGNFIFETNAAGDIIGVKGIDNDESFGSMWAPTNREAEIKDQQGSKTPGVPPVIDIHTAVNIIRQREAFRKELLKDGSKLLNNSEIYPIYARFDKVVETIASRLRNGEFAISPGDTISNRDLDVAASLAGLQVDALRGLMMTWGPQTMREHEEDNSYLGNIEARRVVEGHIPPVFK
jgi:hypothetical protein